jgi:rhamnulokinase
VSAYLAVDLGASSGRVIAGRLKDGCLDLEELGRFANGMDYRAGRYSWDVQGLFENITKAMPGAADALSIGVDAWGVDFGLLGSDGQLLEQPLAYRDSRTDGVKEKFFNKIQASEVYSRTGIQFMNFNTLFQLYSMRLTSDPLLEAAEHLLFIPDLMHYFLCGSLANEYTVASTSQMLDVNTCQWDQQLLGPLQLKPSLLGDIVEPGTVLGELTEDVRRQTGLGPIKVIAPAAHDTASAVVAVPAVGQDWAFLSSGTWSLMGVERSSPVLSNRAREMNFTNEGGVDGSIRFLKNITGLWLLQSCRPEFQQEYDFAELTRLASAAPAFASLIAVDDPRFANPESMSGAIVDFCRETGQTAPANPGQFTRCILESLALRYAQVFEQLEQLHGSSLGRLHIVGGGSQNQFLCQMTADATGREVLAGPAEATVIGNLLVQARALGEIENLAEIRQVLARSVVVNSYKPSGDSSWLEVRQRLESMRRDQ